MGNDNSVMANPVVAQDAPAAEGNDAPSSPESGSPAALGSMNLPEPLGVQVQEENDVEEEEEVEQPASPNSPRGSSDSSELPDLRATAPRSGSSSSSSSDSDSDSDSESSKSSSSDTSRPASPSVPAEKKAKTPPSVAPPTYSYRVLTLQAKNEQAASASNSSTPTSSPVKAKKPKTTPAPKTKKPEKKLIDDERAYEKLYYQSSDEGSEPESDGEEWNKNKGVAWKIKKQKKRGPYKKTAGKAEVPKASAQPSTSSRPSRTCAVAAATRKRVHLSKSPSPSRPESARSMSSPKPKKVPAAKKEKDEFKNLLDRATYTENSRRWFTSACVRSAAKTMKKAGELSDEVYDLIMERTKEIEEPNCVSRTIPLDTKMPSTEDYRGLNTLIKQELFSSHIPMPYDSPSTSSDLQMINFTGSNYTDIHKSKGPGIVNRVKKLGRRSIAELLNREKKLVLLKAKYATKKLAKEEAEVIAPQEHDKFRKGTLPVFTIQINTIDEFEAAQSLIEDSSICIIEGTIEACGFDASRFSPEVLEVLQSDYEMTGPRQMPQSMRLNYPRCPGGGKTSKFPSNSWECPDTQHQIWFPEFIRYFQDVQKSSKKAVERISSHPEKIKEVFDELAVNLTKKTIPLPDDDRGLKGALTIAFGSNIDIENRKYANGDYIFAEQRENVKKFPSFILPDFNYSLLDYCGTYMSGINTPQVYMKVPGVRTAAHLENGCLASINLNLGPGSSIWCSIPLEFTGKFQELIKRKIGLMDAEYERYFDYGFWPNEEELLKEGIPLQKFEQKPGAMVYVGVGTYHWVQANEFTIQVSWNVAPPSHRQLSWLAISHDHYLAHQHPPLIPLEALCWGLAEADAERRHEAPDMDAKMRRVAKTMLMRSLANCQSQLMFVENAELPVNMLEPSRRPERCSECRNWTFNMFLREKSEPRVVRNRVHEPSIYCLACAKALDKLTDPDFEVHQRFEIGKLVEWYDAFSLVPPPVDPSAPKKKRLEEVVEVVQMDQDGVAEEVDQNMAEEKEEPAEKSDESEAESEASEASDDDEE